MRRSLAWLVTGLVLAACAAPADPSASAPLGTSIPPSAAATTLPTLGPATPLPSSPVLPTTEPTGPSWTPLPAESLLLESVVTVTVDRLNKRAKPSVDSKVLGVAERGDFLYLLGHGPFSGEGYTWYQAQLVAEAGDPPTLGVNVREQIVTAPFWVAIAKGSTRYATPIGPRCPEVIDLEHVRYMLGSDFLGCFSSNTLEFTGTFGCGGCGGARIGIYEPDWLAYPLNFNLLSEYPIGDDVGYLAMRFPPAGPTAPPNGSVIRVRGHFDDPAAATCSISVVDPLRPNSEELVAIPSEAAQLVCAQQFVVETMEILGTDPGFIFG